MNYSRMLFPRLVAILGVLLACQVVASAGFIESGVGLDDPEDRYQLVYCCDELLGTLTIDSYYAWSSGTDTGSGIPYTPFNPGLPVTGEKWEERTGAKMKANFVFEPDVDFNCDLRWVQAITGGHGTIGTPPYLDPFNRDDGRPWYWTDLENAHPAYGDGGKQFIDIPGQSNENFGNNVHFEAALVAVNLATKMVYFLAGFTWGYDISMSGTHVDTFAWTTAPSATLQNLVTSWDGSNVKPYAGDGTPDGWTWTQDCICAVPEASSATLMLVAIAGAGGFGYHRRRRAVA